jgi:signal transduction histidine kinase
MRERARRLATDPAADLVLAVVLCAAALLAIAAGDTSQPWATAALAAAVCAPVAVRRRLTLAAGAAEAAVLDAWALLQLPKPWLLFVAPVAVAYALGAHPQTRPGLLAAAGLLAGLIAATWANVVPAAIVTVVPFLLGWAVRARRELVAALAARARELEEEEARLVDFATRRERMRMAAELHDSVGHHLAVVVLQATAGRLAPAGAAAAVTAERMRAIRASADGALADLDRLLDPSDPDDRDADEQVAALVAGVRAAGHEVAVEGRLPDDLPASTRDRAVRVVQEALTNTVKHAPGARVLVRLAAAEDRLVVAVEGTGGGPPSSIRETGSGSGLAGLAREVEAVGGTLAAGPTAGGWAVRALLPAGHP